MAEENNQAPPAGFFRLGKLKVAGAWAQAAAHNLRELPTRGNIDRTRSHYNETLHGPVLTT